MSLWKEWIAIGLDNGFVVKSDKRKIKKEDLPKDIVFPFPQDDDFELEIVYWRKNWGLRGAILDIIGKGENETYYYPVDTPEEVFNIVHAIFSFMNEVDWEMKGDSIWTYDEIKPILERDIINLILMIPFMRKNPDVYLEFYDSY